MNSACNQSRVWRRQAFNMIEIALAMAVIGIALLSVVSLVPIGSKAASEAAGENYSADAAAEMLQWLAHEVTDDADWTAIVQTALTESVPNMSSIAATPADAVAALGAGNWNHQQGSIYSHNTLDGVYRLTQTTTYNGRQVQDVDVIVRLWKQPVSAYTWDSGSTAWVSHTDGGYANYAQINMEVSWPAQLPFSARKKAYYSIEVSR